MNKAGSLDPKVEMRLNRLLDDDEPITFVTGRDLNDALAIMKNVHLKMPCAVYSGSAVYNPCKNELMQYWSLPHDEIEKLSGTLNRSRNVNITYIQDGQIRKEKFRREIVDGYPVLSVSLRDRKDVVNTIYKQIVEQLDNFCGIVVQKYSDPNDDTSFIIDITSCEGNKGTAACYIADYLGVRNENIAAFGNDDNDIPLSQAAGNFYLVGDAEPRRFENVRNILPFNEGGTVVDFIEKELADDDLMPSGIEVPLEGWKDDVILSYIEPGKSARAPGGRFMGYPQTTPHSIALKAYEKYLPYNTNQIGVFSDIHNLGSKTRKMEYEVLHMLGGLYGIDEPEGYITSGGTEGNIVGIWCGRNLLSKSAEKLYIVKTELSHSSVSKAANIMNLPEIMIGYNDRFQMDLEELKEKLSVIAAPDTGFILIATLGYTNTGTCDDIRDVSKILTEIGEKYGAKSYIHIDAAIGGMVYPFVDSEHMRFFELKNVYSMTIDPHKMGYQPFSCGVFLGRKDLLLNIETECTYSRTHRERTLIGSRNGAAAAACWSTLMSMGVEGFRKTLKSLIERKKEIVRRLESAKQIRVISNPPTNMCTIQFLKCADKLLPSEVEAKYAIHAFSLRVNGSVQNCYKIYIMPHLEDDTINEFVEDIMKIGAKE